MKIISKRGRAVLGVDTTIEQRAAIWSSAMDPVYFINNFFRIQHGWPSAGHNVANIILYPYQEEYVRALMHNANVVAVMPRQAGTTSVTIGYLIWQALFHSHENIVIGASSLAQSGHLCQVLHLGVAGVPAFICPQLKYTTRNMIEFDNGSRITVRDCSGTFIKGMRTTCIYLDNFAHCTPRAQNETWMAVATSAGGCIMASAPNGTSNTFAMVWENNTNGTSTRFMTFKRTINDLPQYDARWQHMMKKALGESAWRRDFLGEFV